MDSLPFFSIIIPTYNRPVQLKNCLNAISGLNYPKEWFEVLVVDDGSEVELSTIVTAYKDRLDIYYFKKENEGPAAARNMGVVHAKGKFIAFTDDDCEPASDWLKAAHQYLTKNPDRLVGGRTINKLKKNPFAATSQLIVDIVYEHYNQNREDARFFASNNMFVPTDLLKKVGKFQHDWRTSEDRELCDRWHLHGYKMTYLLQAVIYHSHPLTFWRFCKQHFSYGQGAYRFHKIRKERKSGKMQEEMRFHANINNWLFEPFKREKAFKATGMFVLMVVWQVANLIGFLYEMIFPANRNPEK